MTICLTQLLVAREISSKTLDELESLIKAYKKSIGEVRTRPSDVAEKKIDAHAASEHGLLVSNNKSAKLCGRSTRFRYKDCFGLSKSENERENCAQAFVEQYQECYFSLSLSIGSKDLFACEGTCLWNFDNCLINSSKVEMFVCMNGRDKCRQNCPWAFISGNEKRGLQSCHNNCEGNFDQCADAIKYPFEQAICAAHRGICRKKC